MTRRIPALAAVAAIALTGAGLAPAAASAKHGQKAKAAKSFAKADGRKNR